MSKTRNERIQSRNTVLFIVLLLLVFCNIFVALYKYLLVQHEAEVMPDPVPEVSVQIQTIRSVQTIPDIPDIPEEVANKEAQMPEFGYDYGYVCAVVASECRGEPYEGQLAVAQCIRTTAERKWLTPEEVVKLPNRYADPCTYASEIELVRDACCDVFVHGISATDEPIEYFYSTVGGFVSKWHENNLEFVMEIGNHRFFKEAD